MTKVVGAFDVLFLNRYDSILKDDLFGIDPTVALDADFKKLSAAAAAAMLMHADAVAFLFHLERKQILGQLRSSLS